MILNHYHLEKLASFYYLTKIIHKECIYKQRKCYQTLLQLISREMCLKLLLNSFSEIRIKHLLSNQQNTLKKRYQKNFKLLSRRNKFIIHFQGYYSSEIRVCSSDIYLFLISSITDKYIAWQSDAIFLSVEKWKTIICWMKKERKTVPMVSQSKKVILKKMVWWTIAFVSYFWQSK